MSDKLKSLSFHYHNAYGHPTWQCGDTQLGADNLRVIKQIKQGDGLPWETSNLELWSFDQREFMWQIEKVISSFSSDLWALNLARRWL